jgi:YD repeat-containing protein
MSDESGACTYNYDQLSRVTSETHTFNGLSGSYPLSYEYNLGGELKKITDPTNATIDYNYDLSGRVSSITAENNLYGGVSQYASEFAYRAWGGIKGLTYGNGYTLAVSYNSRLQGTQFEVAGRPAQFGSSTVMKTQYQYYADGSLKFANDLLDERFDRANSYDHVAMLKEAYTGSESRDYVNGTNSGTQTGPYRQSYQHDVFANMTQRDNRFWSQSDSLTASYTNNRRVGFTYDADGRLIQDDDLQYHYDAAGRSASIFDAEINKWLTLVRDGDGRLAKRVETQGSPITTAYYVRSSVLGGRIITELNQNGQKQKGYVFAGEQVLAEQQNNVVTWKYTNPLTGSRGGASTDGQFNRDVEPDPTGVNVGLVDPFLFCCTGPPAEPFVPMLTGDSGSCGSNPNCTTCYLDGFEIGCDRAMHLLDIGAADLQVTLNDGRRITVPVESFGIGLFRIWIPGQSGNSSNEIDYSGDISTVRTNNSTPGHWETFTFNFAPQDTGQHFAHAPQNTQTREQRLITETRNNLINILNSNNGNNPCAQFFGGAANAIAALNAMPFTPGQLANYRTGISMNIPLGPVAAGTSYIVPNSATVNTRGGFYQSFAFDQSSGRTVQTPNFGGYGSNNNRSRALQMFHELGHVIVTGRNPDGTPQLLLSVDGPTRDPSGRLSEQNTRAVVNACRNQLNSIRN